MRRQIYGRTWWGAKWLDALSQIDFDNRLPRGRTYANNGSVRQLSVAGSIIHARVLGSRRQPYQVQIRVPAITKQKARHLLDRIATDPALIARMLNRELDPSLLDTANELGIQVFPSRWRDLHMDCSCPDLAVPCKHLAAVIYLLSSEIDGDPFLVFSLRGIDLSEALKSHDIWIDNRTETSLPGVPDLLWETEDTATGGGSVAMLEQLDFSRIPDLADPLQRVLPEQPAFFSGGDFRSTYASLLRRVAKEVRWMLNDRAVSAGEADTGPFHAPDRPRLELDARYRVRLTGLQEPLDWPEVVEALDGVDAARLADRQPELAALYYVRLLAMHLLAAGAVVPQLFSLGGKAVGLRWLPATMDPVVRDLMAQTAEALPETLIMARKGRRKIALPADTRAMTLCSLFLDQFVRDWSAWETAKPYGDKTIALLFGTGEACYDGPGEGSVPAGIQAWLARFHLERRSAAPVLRLNTTRGDTFTLTLAVENRTDNTRPVPLSRVLTGKNWEATRLEVLQTVALLAEFFPPLNDYVRSGAKSSIRLTAEELSGLLFDTLPVLRLLGIRVLMPRALERLLQPRLSLRVKGDSQANVDGAGFIRADDLFAFDWQVAIGDHLLSAEEFEKLVKKATGVVRFRGEYLYLDADAIERLREQLRKPPSVTGPEVMQAALAGDYAGATVELDPAARRLIRQFTETGKVPLPKGLRARLRPYQRRGYAWLYRNARIGFGSVLADDMGLGKTLQVIAVLQKLKQDGELDQGKALIVVPTSLLTNWQKECTRFAPELSVEVFHGSRRELGKKQSDLLLTSYGIARREAKKLQSLPWRLLVVDEAQNIKNSNTAQTRAVKAIPAGSRIAMSGTPVENRLAEYWSIMDFVNRGYLGGIKPFAKNFAVPIETHQDQRVLERFRRITAPFLLRRLKTDKNIIGDLPDKIEQDQYCTLTPDQTALYESVVQEGLRVIRGESDTFKRQGLVLQMILALKQICNHPAQYLHDDGEEPDLSGKGRRFLELVDDIHAGHEKALVFTQFRDMGQRLCRWLESRYDHAPLFLHGGVSRKRRDTMIERFQDDRTERVFVLSLKAGGTGLNLTAATNVIHYDLWWNPAVEQQATDRAYRIGQRHNVQVHRFITRATFEERINEMIRNKRELAELTVGTGETWIGNMSNKELESLFTLNS